MSDLSDFLRKKKVEYEQEQVNWDMVKTEWIQLLNEFMTRIKIWLQHPQKEGLINVIEKNIEITEEHIGTYKAPFLELYIGAESIKITPVGLFIVGASGRIDITSYLDQFIILHHSQKGWIYRNVNQQGSFKRFTKESFTKMLKDLV